MTRVSKFALVGVAVLGVLFLFYPKLAMQHPDIAVVLVVGPPMALFVALGYISAQAQTVAMQQVQIGDLVRQVAEGNAEIARQRELILLGEGEIGYLQEDLAKRDARLVALTSQIVAFNKNGASHD